MNKFNTIVEKLEEAIYGVNINTTTTPHVIYLEATSFTRCETKKISLICLEYGVEFAIYYWKDNGGLQILIDVKE